MALPVVVDLPLSMAAAGNGGLSLLPLLPAALLLFLLRALGADGASTTFSFANACVYPVWVGVLHGANSPPLDRSGFYLPSGEATQLAAPSSGAWSGTFWARTGCATDSDTGVFSCATADCGSGAVTCDGRGPKPPVTLVEVTLAAPGSSGQLDFYDVSLVDGFNVPVRMAPFPGGNGSSCGAAACAGDVNAVCPEELRVVGASGVGVVACKSACNEYGSPRYCCSGEYGTPAACGPTNYSQVFKTACPAAYSYAYDDATSTFTCSGASAYDVTFCPDSSSIN